MDIGTRIGGGRTADVYALGTERAVKRFKDGTPLDTAEREATNTRIAVDAGLPVPTAYEVNSVGGNPTITFERVRGESMLSRVQFRPWTLRKNARRLAQLHARIHAVRPSGLSSVRERLTRNIQQVSELEPEVRERALSKIEQLPQGRSLCHGDFHPENVLLADEPIIIDWLDAGRGHPAADVARTNLLLKYAAERESRLLSTMRALFRRWYLQFYCERSHVSRDQIRAWELPVAVARLTEGAPEEARLRSFIYSRLENE